MATDLTPRTKSSEGTLTPRSKPTGESELWSPDYLPWEDDVYPWQNENAVEGTTLTPRTKP